MSWHHLLFEHPITAELIWSFVLPKAVENGTCSLEKIVRRGILKYLVYYHEKGYGEWHSYIMDWAAENGHIEIVKWLHENRTEGCTKHAMNWAAYNGHVEIVKWLHENRNEAYIESALLISKRYNHTKIVEYLQQYIKRPPQFVQ